MNLIELSKQIEDRYIRYLETTFYFKDPVLRKSFEEKLSMGHLSKGPYLEATPVFRRGKRTDEIFRELLSNLSDEGFLRAIWGDRYLYLHQEEAIQKVFGEGHNIVVATGTASGKTEVFFHPILLHLYKEFQEDQLGPGVRALILYPMNALANDQRDRLGEICKRLQKENSPFKFTFGQYIGETPEDENDSGRHARDHIARRLPGEIVLRKEMRENPPHILLTNYSMLEYLLIRPDDSPLFDNGRAQYWTYIVLDEAHQYRGSNGIEMGMLLRRLKRRLREGGRKGPFRCIATSATIAGGNRDKVTVAKFASELFSEEFQGANVILGTTERIPDSGIINLSLDDYRELRQILNSHSLHDLSKVSRRLDLTISKGLDLTRGVGYILQHDRRSTKLREFITSGPKDVHELGKEIFTDMSEKMRMDALSELVELLTQTEDSSSGTPLLCVRYHFFLRSLEGAYVSYFPAKTLFLEKHSQVEKGKVFEIALCRECGQHYLVGKFKNGFLQEAMRDPGHPDFGATFFRPIEDSNDEYNEEGNTPENKIFQLCIECGAMIQVDRRQNRQICGHTNSILIEEQKGAEEKEDQVPRCSACGYRSPDPVREVVHGTDGPHAVIATTLYQKLPQDRRKVLAFADGRQEAAFFAWYLENSYKDIFNRNLILKAVKRLSPHTREGISLRELATGLRDIYRENNVFPSSIGDLELKQEAWIRIYREFLTDEPRISLEGVGLLRWYIKWPKKFIIPNILFSPPWSLEEQEALNLIFILLDFMRTDKAIELRTTDDVSLIWDDLVIQASQMRVLSIEKGKLKWGERKWSGKTGKRTQFLIKLLMKKEGLTEQGAVEHSIEALRAIWEAFRQSDESIQLQDHVLLPVDDARRLNPDWWRIFPLLEDEFIYLCDTCARPQFVSISGVCARHRCPGSLQEIQTKALKPSHYRLLYEDNLPGMLRTEEHTAQIDKEKAREFQRAFKTGEIHILSSSTTFELGVDLGDLDIIFLRNVPPESFNYAQRVGRAGRRSGFPGFAITFCRRNPHDLYHFIEPCDRILKGTIRPPVIGLRNEKIIARHITAVTLSCFFRHSPERFQNVEKLFGNIEHPFGVRDFLDFLKQYKIQLEKSLSDIIPGEMASKIGLNDEKWIDLITGEDSRFLLAEIEVSSDFRTVKEIERDFSGKGNYRPAEWASRRADTIATEDTLSFLSRKAIIPKYGFPVDVVELDPHRTQQTSESLEVLLQRDLAIAISEFAPTSKLIANKKEWVSYGVKKVPEREWTRKFYRRCSKHNLFISWSPGKVASLEKCCNSAIDGCYIVPQFGFVTNRQGPGEPKGRPHRVFTTRPYFVNLIVSEPDELDFEVICLKKASPGLMVMLCEGRRGCGFYICGQCGAGFRERKNQHETPYGEICSGTLEQLSLGHEFVTDVLQIQFLLGLPKNVHDSVWFAYSLAYAIVEGTAEILEVPSIDLSATVAYSSECLIPPIILYDNVQGGAGLVACLEKKEVLKTCLEAAFERVNGNCGCGEDDSCYGCLRSYRNQFAHPHLRRGPVKQYLKMLLERLKG